MPSVAAQVPEDHRRLPAEHLDIVSGSEATTFQASRRRRVPRNEELLHVTAPTRTSSRSSARARVKRRHPDVALPMEKLHLFDANPAPRGLRAHAVAA